MVFVPEGSAPPNGGTVTVGDRFVLDLMLNSGTYDNVTAQQSYLTYTYNLLQNARVDQISNACVLTGTVSPDATIFDASLQNQVCNGPGQCNFRGNLIDPGSIAYASGALANCEGGCGGTFRVAQVGLCAVAPGQALLHWQFTPPAPLTRDSEIVNYGGVLIHNPALYTDYTINIVNPTPTPDAPRLVGHLTIGGRPAQPDALQSVPITLTLRASGGGPENSYSTNTDAGGFFTVTSPGPGSYDWRVKNPQTLADSGSVTLPSTGTTQQEMGLLLMGDANNDNCVSALDFTILKGSFGKALGDSGYDPRADFNGDNMVSSTDFILIKGTFGQCGAGPVRPVP